MYSKKVRRFFYCFFLMNPTQQYTKLISKMEFRFLCSQIKKYHVNLPKTRR
jgi:hypothetical protein